MTRSHPPTLLTAAERALRDEVRLERGARVLLAVSGGPDSMALLHVLSRLSQRLGFTVAAHGVDHGLRSAASAELDRAEAFAASLNVPFGRSTLRVAPGGNLQARARDGRYAALREHARREGASWIATAHHADDRAETVLLRLLRGTSLSGLAVFGARSTDLIRPFLRARRAQVIAHVERHRVPYSLDPSNHDVRFVRTRVRRELLPLLESLSPRIVEHLTELADDAAASAPSAHATGSTGLLLGTAQRAALRSMVERRSGRARIRLRGGAELRFDPKTGALIVDR